VPWFPDFVSAAELARRETRAVGRSDPVGEYFDALTHGDDSVLASAWPGEVVVYDPRAGEVRGGRRLRRFVRRNEAWLGERNARIEPVAATRVGSRAVVELLAHLTEDGRELAWPVAVVAESVDDLSVVFRTYCSQWPVDGQPHVRSPILPAGVAGPDGVVGRYQTALAAGDTDAIVATFTPDGYFREPFGPHYVHSGTGELRSYFAQCVSSGGIGLEACAVIDDGTRCAVEYNFVRWNGRDVTPQAGIGIHERSPDGLLAAVRVYDDIDQPSPNDA
jgi:ketosteroid isomerase-like protein